jgi:hypothetical protein
LRSSFGLRHCEVEPWQARWTGSPFSSHDLQRLRRLYPCLESIGGHRITGYVDLHENGTEFKYFTILRDPLKTCASRFQYNIQYREKKHLVFEEWIQQEWPRDHQTKMIAGVADANEAIRIIQEKNIFVGLTERFDETMLLLKALRASNLNIAYRRVNVATNNTLAKDLLANQRTRQMLIEANQADLELYEHVKREIYPTFQRAYGSSLEADVANYQEIKDNNFNKWNLSLSRLKQYVFYKPLLELNRKGIKVV